MTFEPVTENDYDYLYALLSERAPEACISHKAMPTLVEHYQFMDKKPYREDYVIWKDAHRVGRVYITKDNRIGIHTTDGSDEEVLQHFMKPGLQAEVAPGNHRMMNLLQKNGFTLYHHTFIHD